MLKHEELISNHLTNFSIDSVISNGNPTRFVNDMRNRENVVPAHHAVSNLGSSFNRTVKRRVANYEVQQPEGGNPVIHYLTVSQGGKQLSITGNMDMVFLLQLSHFTPHKMWLNN